MSTVIRIYAGGKIKNSLFAQAWEHYLKQMRRWRVETHEVMDKDWPGLSPLKHEYWIALSDRGKSMDSPEFATYLQKCTATEQTPCFLIGPCQGLPASVMAHAHAHLCLGSMTWPHLMARLLILEQIYRAQQRLCQHPYSRL
jgi:rRNA large subunit m3Psi methyltransferase RlmH